MTSVAQEQGVVETRSGSHALAEFLARFRELGIVLALVIVVGATTWVPVFVQTAKCAFTTWTYCVWPTAPFVSGG